MVALDILFEDNGNMQYTSDIKKGKATEYPLLDTGAQMSTISLESLCCLLNCPKVQILSKCTDRNKIDLDPAIGASGVGYIGHIENVSINGFELNRFNFVLAMSNKKLFVLGYDFISCCSSMVMNKQIVGNAGIRLYGKFDESKYNNFYDINLIKRDCVNFGYIETSIDNSHNN